MRFRSSGRPLLLASLAAAWLAASPGAWGRPSPAQSCQAKQLRAFGAFTNAAFRCWSAHHREPAADPTGQLRLAPCLAAADGAWQASFQRALARAGVGVCGNEDDTALLGDVQLEVDGLAFAVSGGNVGVSNAERALHSALQKALGASLARAFAAESRHAAHPDELRRATARDRSRTKLFVAFAKHEAKALRAGVGYAGMDAVAAAGEADRIVDELVALTAPAGGTSFTLAGTFHAAEGSAVDSDVNDPNTVYVPNDGSAATQPVAVPAVVGGYVNLAGAGADGSSFASGDPRDWYRVSLAAGQRMNLRMAADPAEADLDLCLYATSNPLVPLDCSLGATETEELTAPSSGSFFVEVEAFSLCECASSYVLTLGQAVTEGGGNGLRLSDAFRPGEVIVRLAKEMTRAGGPRSAEAFAPRFGMRALGGASDREMLFTLGSGALERAVALETLGVATAARAAFAAKLGLIDAERHAKLDTILAVKALARRADVAAAEPNHIVRADAVPNDPSYPLQWHYPLIRLPAAWDVTTGSRSVEVAVVDTGVLFGHPDLSGQLVSGFDFISDSEVAADGDGIDPNASDPGDGGGGRRSSFHGTHVAGTIGAATSNGRGVAGVAWNVTLVPLRVLGVGGGSLYDILQAVRYAAGLPNDSGTARKVDVINLSLGGTSYSSQAAGVFDEARDAGVIVAAAAGNSNTSQPHYPAAYPGVVSVSAVDLRKEKAPYSNFGSSIDVAAPGGDTSQDRNGDGYADGVLSTLKNEDTGAFNYVLYQGTSMAAPHVTGVVALMKAVKPGLSPAELDTLLASGTITEDLGAPGRDDIFGHGLIDARNAVIAAGGASVSSPVLEVTPTGLNLGASTSEAGFSIRNGGGGTLSVSSVTVDAPWLSVTASDVDANGVGTYTASADRAGLATGTYNATISVASSAGDKTVSVVMSAGSSDADAGYHYVLLLDPETLETVAQAETSAIGGQYVYELPDVPAGRYLLLAGSDPDNDLAICGGGEACGAYPTFGTPEIVEVTSDRTGLDFVTGFLQTIGTDPANPLREPLAFARRKVSPPDSVAP
jgi:serine protease